MLSPSNTIAAHHKGTARVAAISGRCCFAAPMNLIATVKNHTAMIDEVLTQSPMPITIIITAIRQHPFCPLPQDRCGYIVTWLIISLRRMPNNGATCLSFQELKKFHKTCSSSHIHVLETLKATVFILKSCGCYAASHGCSTQKSLVSSCSK